MATKPKEEQQFAPDLFIVPGVVMLHPELQPADKTVYAVIYWLEHLKLGRCTASNSTIANMIGVSTGGVKNALTRLRDAGFIQCNYGPKGGALELTP